MRCGVDGTTYEAVAVEIVAGVRAQLLPALLENLAAGAVQRLRAVLQRRRLATGHRAGHRLVPRVQRLLNHACERGDDGTKDNTIGMSKALHK